MPPAAVDAGTPSSRTVSLPLHLERASLKLTTARATGAIGAEADAVIDRLSQELDAAQRRRLAFVARPGEAIARLTALDEELLRVARASIDAHVRCH